MEEPKSIRIELKTFKNESDFKSNGIQITYIKSRKTLSIFGWHKSAGLMDSYEISLEDFLDKLGIEPKRLKCHRPRGGIMNLKITVTQARIIRNACELFSRLHMGQIDELRHLNLSKRPNDDCIQTELLIKALKMQLFPELASNAYYGIQSPEIPDAARIAYDLHQVIRKHLNGEKPEGSFSYVRYDEPHQTGAEPLAEVEEKKK